MGINVPFQIKQVVFRIAIVMPMAMAFTPLELIGPFIAWHTDVVIEVSDVFDVRGEADQLSIPIPIQASLIDVAIRLADLHDLGLKAADDGLFNHDEIGSVAGRISREMHESSSTSAMGL